MLHRRSLLALGAAAALPGAALAQGSNAAGHWPDRPLRMVVPFPPGSTPDIVARIIAQHYSAVLGQPCVADNRVGAGGNLGTDAVAKAADGHTIGLTINGPLATAPALYPSLPYDPQKDLAPVSLVARAGQVLVVHPSVPAKTLEEFVAYGRANPTALTFGSVGAGSGGHLAMEDLKARGGFQAEHVPYRGFPQAVLDLVAGRISAVFLTIAGILPQIREGQVHPLVVTTEARLPQIPEVPTLAEAGFPGAASYAWNALVAPASMPGDRIALLAREAKVALTAPQGQKALQTAGFEVVGSSPAECAAFIQAETARWGALIKQLGITAE
ncbi:tripartite tricarboxylate transporter substrate binding protein [Pseudoroseomonas wenyumeiae]|uniref:Tripartite tricarboxylate transporter substrate binding protein n=1 Tax=Teichococcus wenyumeiae TaxID=2478470 RepID=A0A3A9JHU9_9PROT|nr:tripartite tricarboxylate transporter substrate binding protein [Pseudoroseomonas wenyumeiae]RKK04313.1 tripartite tricarboxylate transporter substrate binding protein [Pseudoroseomonas wenyumeiae]RMI26587.1 tripartite tricarboxylate transporter substrate binding protein [Pseudoroseomonas wenyumeiae]